MKLLRVIGALASRRLGYTAIQVAYIFVFVVFGIQSAVAFARGRLTEAIWLIAAGALVLSFYQVALMNSQLELQEGQSEISKEQGRVAQRQLDLMEGQAKILLRAARLEVYSDVAESEPFDAKEDVIPSGSGAFSARSTRFYIVNSGTRGTEGYSLSVRTESTARLRVRAVDWRAYYTPAHAIFKFESKANIFPGEVHVAPNLALAGSGRVPGFDSDDVRARIAYNDGGSDWDTLKNLSEMPSEFKRQIDPKI